MTQEPAYTVATQLQRDIRKAMPGMRLSVKANRNEYSMVDITLVSEIDSTSIARIYELCKYYIREFLLQYCSCRVLRTVPVVNNIRLIYKGK